MKILCENCHNTFTFDPAPGHSSLNHISCPECEYPNPVPASQSPAPSQALVLEVEPARCKSCGKPIFQELDPSGDECQECRHNKEDAQSVKEWMIRKLNGQIYGPFETATIKAWIEAGKMEPRDEVAKVGGQWRSLESHPTFARTFPGASSAPEVSSERPGTSHTHLAQKRPSLLEQLKKKKPTAFQIRDFGENVVGLIGTGGALALSWFLIQSQWLVIPDSWLETFDRHWTEQITSRLDRTERASIAWEEYQKVLTRLQSERKPSGQPVALLYLQARHLLLEDSAYIQNKVRPLLEEALLADPENDLAISALAEVYAQSSDVSLQQDASRLIDVAEELNPGNAETHRARAVLYISTKNPDKARAEGTAALERNPSDAEALLTIGSSYLRYAEPNWQESLSYLKKAVAADPRLHRAWHELGQVYVSQKEYQKALEAYQKKLELAPNSASTLTEMARLMELVGEYPRAIELYEKAHLLSKGQEPRATLALAVLLYQRRGDTRRARELLSSILPAQGDPILPLPEHKQGLVQLATCYRLEGSNAEALNTLERAMKMDANFGPALFQKGLTLLAANRLDEAGQALRAAGAAESDPEVGADIKFYVGQVLSRQSKTKDALQEYEDAIEEFKYHIPSYLGLIQLHLALSQTEEAQSRAHELARLDPLYLIGRTQNTLYFHRPPAQSSAAMAFQKVAQEKFYISDSFSGLAAIQLRLGMKGQAVQNLGKALEVKENDPTALFNLGMIAIDQGNAGGAAKYFSTLLEQDSQLGLAWVYLLRAQTELGRLDLAADAQENAQRYERTNPALLVHQAQLSLRKGDRAAARKALLKAVDQDAQYLTARRELFKLQKLPD